MPVAPDCDWAFEVYPDEEREQVAALLALRRRALEVLARAPGATDGLLDLAAPPDDASAGFGDRLVRTLAAGLREGIAQHSVELRAVEVAVAEVTEEVGGEPALRPDVQAMLDGMKAQLADLHEHVAPADGAFELPEPGEEDVELVRQFIARAAED